MIWPKKHKADVEKAKEVAAEAQEALEAAKKNWRPVERAVKKSRELREANGWTEALTDIFGGRA